jgi:hypothetical protein
MWWGADVSKDLAVSIFKMKEAARYAEDSICLTEVI